MWLYIPKKDSMKSPSVQDTTVSVSDCDSLNPDIEQSAWWRGSCSPLETWRKRCNSVYWMKHLSGITLKPLMADLGLEEWTLSQVAFPVSPGRLQDKRRVSKIDAGFGNQYIALYERSDQGTFSWRKSQDLFPQDFPLSSATLPKSGIASPGIVFEHPTWVRPIKGRDSSSLLNWPTARVSDGEGGRIRTEMTDGGFRSERQTSGQFFGAKLRDAVETFEETNWATPDTQNHRRGDQVRKEAYANHGMSLHHQVETSFAEKGKKWKSDQWPTPRAEKITDEKQESWEARFRRGDVSTPPLTLAVQMEEQKNWPTPTMMDGLRAGKEDDPEYWEQSAKAKKEQGINKQYPLNIAVKDEKNWATPQAFDSVDVIRQRSELSPAALQGGCSNLREQVVQEAMKGWPTPTCRDYKDTGNLENVETNCLLGRAVKDPEYMEMTEQSNQNWPTPKTGSNRNSRKAIMGGHPNHPGKSDLSLEQAAEVAEGILPREVNNSEELPPRFREMFPTPTAVDHKSRGPNSKQTGLDNLHKKDPASMGAGSENFSEGTDSGQSQTGKSLTSRKSGQHDQGNSNGGGSLQESSQTGQLNFFDQMSEQMPVEMDAEGDWPTMRVGQQVHCTMAVGERRVESTGYHCNIEEKMALTETQAPKMARLNPRWSETLMGLPTGWACVLNPELMNYDSLATELCQWYLRWHGLYSKVVCAVLCNLISSGRA